VEQAVAPGAPKALAGSGLLARWWAAGGTPAERSWLRFGDGRPLSAVPPQFLAWGGEQLAAAGKPALRLVWANAGWPISREGRTGLAEHNRQVKAGTAVGRIVPCPLPTKRPWRNPSEPQWVHGKRKGAEPARLLPAPELEERVDAALAADHADHLTMPEKVA
jgi:hypothetical protein